uniref:NAD(+) ADP-ribosyltransferase n=1 Tax=Chrysemys picta bellii TaxID=8478 RepID=A0A8C3FCE6_CHRPI
MVSRSRAPGAGQALLPECKLVTNACPGAGLGPAPPRGEKAHIPETASPHWGGIGANAPRGDFLTSHPFPGPAAAQEVPISPQAHIYCEGDDVYDVMLNQTNLQFNNNKFYVLQLLEDDGPRSYSVWTRWGRGESFTEKVQLLEVSGGSGKSVPPSLCLSIPL